MELKILAEIRENLIKDLTDHRRKMEYVHGIV